MLLDKKKYGSISLGNPSTSNIHARLIDGFGEMCVVRCLSLFSLSLRTSTKSQKNNFVPRLHRPLGG